MDTPNSFLVNPLRPVSFQPTRNGREPRGPRFARQGIAIQRLVTADDGDEAIAAVMQAEYDALSTDERQDRARLDQHFRLAVRDRPAVRYPTGTVGVPAGARALRSCEP